MRIIVSTAAHHSKLYVLIQSAMKNNSHLKTNAKDAGKNSGKLDISKGGYGMSLVPFTRNYEDNSTEAGFQFTFYCDLCNNGYKSNFTESSTHKKTSFLKGFGRAINLGASILGQHDVGWNVEHGTDILSERFEGMSPEWHREHEGAFEQAQNEAKRHFTFCPKCRKWVCDDCWNEQDGLCVECAPRMSVEVTAARAQKMVEDIQEKAANTQVFKGNIERMSTVCPVCGKPAGSGKFCNNCGANLSLGVCPKCGEKNAQGARFCSECGEKL